MPLARLTGAFLFIALTGNMMPKQVDAAEKVRIRGVLTDGGIICPLLMSECGYIFPLMGIGKYDYPIGTRLDLTGAFVRYSPCQQGDGAFRVDSVDAVDNSGN